MDSILERMSKQQAAQHRIDEQKVRGLVARHPEAELLAAALGLDGVPVVVRKGKYQP